VPVSFDLIEDFTETHLFNKNDKHFFDLNEKQIPTKKSKQNLLYKDYNWCVELLQKGIMATKFSFNKPDSAKAVIVKLNKACTEISYSNQV
jgi:hypothetical protein